MTPADPTDPDSTAPPPKAAKVAADRKRKPTRKRDGPKRKAAAGKAAAGKARVEKVGPARLAKRKGPGATVWDLPPEPEPVVEVAPLLAPKPKGRVGRILLVGVVVLALAALGVATQVTSVPNTGTVKVHDGTGTQPETRNEPHVEGDVYVEGSNMAADSGDLFFFSWPPTGNGELVLETTWAADAGEPAFHFLAGPFELPCGHYRVGASNGAAEPEDFPGGMKKKTFWVECPDEEPEPEPEPTTSSSSSTGPEPTTSTGPSPSPEPEPEPEPEPGMGCPDVSATAREDGSVELAWTAAPGSDGTNIYRATGDGDFEYLTTTTGDAGTYVDTTTEAGNAYTYYLTGLFGNEESEGCAIVEVTAIPDLPTVLGAGLAMGGSLLAFALLSRRKA